MPRTSRTRLVASARHPLSAADAEVGRPSDRIVVATDDRDLCSVRGSSGERRGDRRLLSLAARRSASARAARLDDRANRRRPRRAGAAPARRRAYRQHSARLLRSRRGGDLRAGRRSARDSYRTYGATRTPERECPRQHEWAGLPAGRSKRLRIRQDHCHRAIAVGGVVRTHAGEQHAHCGEKRASRRSRAQSWVHEPAATSSAEMSGTMAPALGRL